MNALTLSHKGKRELNQDLVIEQTCKDGSYLVAVIDGMGGYDYGDLAAQIVAENIVTYMSTVESVNAFHIQKAINKSNLAIRQNNMRLSGSMGATVGGIVLKGSNATFFWVGDVKVYHFRNNRLLFESRSHTLINDLVESGSLTENGNLLKYKHIVTRSVNGDVKKSMADFYEASFIVNSDLIMVCSDGVSDLMEGLQIEDLLQKTSTKKDLFESIKSRLLNEGDDNFSLILLT